MPTLTTAEQSMRRMEALIVADTMKAAAEINAEAPARKLRADLVAKAHAKRLIVDRERGQSSPYFEQYGAAPRAWAIVVRFHRRRRSWFERYAAEQARKAA